MRLYQQPHAFYAGVDLHARFLFTQVLDRRGRTVVNHPGAAKNRSGHRRLKAPAITPRRARLQRA